MQEKTFRFHDLNLKYYDYSDSHPASLSNRRSHSSASNHPASNQEHHPLPLVLFVHANGYSSGCYRQYHEALSQKFRVIALDFAGHGQSESTLDFNTWFFFRDQILALLQQELEPGQKAIGIGHSLGGASTLLASEKSPHLFAKAIVMDPVVLGWRITILAKLMEGPLAKGARKRRRQFASIELVRRAFSKFPAFANWEPAFFQDYLNTCLRHTGNGKEVELCCDPKVEARIFSLASFRVMRKYHSIKSEVHVAIPENYEVCSPKLARLITQKNPASSITAWKDATHFFPFENKDRTLNWIESRLT